MHNKKFFTLVELIIVIAIIAILSVTAFMIITKWISQSRDSRRFFDLNQIEKSMDLFIISNYTNKYPQPDEPRTTITLDQGTAWIQGYFAGGLSSSIDSFNRLPQDPDGSNYEYSITENREDYQVKAEFENINAVSLVDQSYATEPKYVRIVGNNIEERLLSNSGDNYYLWNVPSMFMYSGNQLETGDNKYIYRNLEDTNYAHDIRVAEVSDLVNSGSLDNIQDVILAFSGIVQINTGDLIEILSKSLGGTEIGEVVETIVCNTGYYLDGESCSDKWQGNGSYVDAFIFRDNNGSIVYPENCNELISGSLNYNAANISSVVTYDASTSSNYKTGFYMMKPDAASSAFSVYCDMDTENGGWTRLFKYNPWKDNVTYLGFLSGLDRLGAYNEDIYFGDAFYTLNFTSSMLKQNGLKMGDVYNGALFETGSIGENISGATYDNLIWNDNSVYSIVNTTDRTTSDGRIFGIYMKIGLDTIDGLDQTCLNQYNATASQIYVSSNWNWGACRPGYDTNLFQAYHNQGIDNNIEVYVK